MLAHKGALFLSQLYHSINIFSIEAMNLPKLICSDVDGTLLRDDKSFSERNKETIKRVMNDRGIKFMIVTGRMYSAIAEFYNELGVDGIASCLNGALLYENGKIIISHKIDRDVALGVYKLSKQFGLDMISINDDLWYSEKHSGFLYDTKRPIYRKDSILSDFNSLLKSVDMNKLLFMTEDKEKLEALRTSLMERYKDVTYYYSDDFLEIMPPHVNKGSDIDDISRYLNIDKSEIMAIGDDYNDKEMLEKAGFSFAMGNAPDIIKNSARFITDTNENDGVAKAIERVFFS